MIKYIVYFVAFFAFLYVLVNLPYIIKYMRSDYGTESGVSMIRFLLDKGAFGEGLTFMALEKVRGHHKILTNLYLPTEDGTTEVDIVFINRAGIYVLESKNYSGWIFGNERSRTWTSVIYKQKYKFYNPIWQNNKHVKYLKKVVGEEVVKSIIVFSERCEFKDVKADHHTVIKRNILRKTVENNRDYVYDADKIDALYATLKVYANQDQEVKEAHIRRIS